MCNGMVDRNNLTLVTGFVLSWEGIGESLAGGEIEVDRLELCRGYVEVYKNTTPRYIQQLRHEIMTRRIQQGWTVAKICQYYRTCRRTVYKWLARFKRWGQEGLKDLSRRPGRIVGRIASWIGGLIVQIRKNRPCLRPVGIERQLEQATGYSLAAKTVHNVRLFTP